MDTELKAVVDAVEVKLTETFAEYNGQLEEFGAASVKTAADLKALSEEHAALIKETPELKARLSDVEQLLAGGIKGGNDAAESKSWGQNFVESEAFKSYGGGEGTKARIEVKNTILGEASSNPTNVLVPQDRLPGIVPGAFRSLNILDFVMTGATSSNQIEYTREASYTNAAAEAAEGASKAESALTFELVNDPVRTVAHWLKASKQVLDDAPMLASYIDRRMEHGVRRRLQSQILNGNGTAPNIAGLTDTGRHTAFTGTSGESALDSINRAKYNVIAADYEPNFVFMNPADWGAIERNKVGASDDRYAASDGAALAYINGGMTPLVWGLPVVATNDVVAGKFILGDSAAFQLFMRQQAVVEMFEQDDTNVQQNLLTIRAELRAALAVFLPAAIQYGDLETA